MNMTVSPFLASTNSGVNLNGSLPTLTLNTSAETVLARAAAAAAAKMEKCMSRD